MGVIAPCRLERAAMDDRSSMLDLPLSKGQPR